MCNFADNLLPRDQKQVFNKLTDKWIERITATYGR